MKIKYKLYDSNDCLVVDFIHNHGSYHNEFVHLSAEDFEDAVLELAKEIKEKRLEPELPPRLDTSDNILRQQIEEQRITIEKLINIIGKLAEVTPDKKPQSPLSDPDTVTC
jgi:hypothetical protein